MPIPRRGRGQQTGLAIVIRIELEGDFTGNPLQAACSHVPSWGVHEPKLRLAGGADPGDTLPAAVAAWADNLAGRGKKPRTIASFTGFVRTAAKANQWRHPADLTKGGQFDSQ